MALYTNNGHLALENAIAALNLPEGGEVITTPFTFASTTHAIVRNGLIPVFCDVNDRDYTMDVTKIESHITDRILTGLKMMAVMLAKKMTIRKLA